MNSRAKKVYFGLGALSVFVLVLSFQFGSPQGELPAGRVTPKCNTDAKESYGRVAEPIEGSLLSPSNTTGTAFLRGGVARDENDNRNPPKEGSIIPRGVNRVISNQTNQTFAGPSDSFQGMDTKGENFLKDKEASRINGAEEHLYHGGEEDEGEPQIDGNNQISDVEVSNQVVDDCHADAAGRIAALTNYARNHFLKNMVDVTQNAREDATPIPEAVCHFPANGNFAHFPHMMQSFTRCFSFFRSHADRAPVIVKRRNSLYRATFNAGMLDIFRDVFNGTVLQSHHYKTEHYSAAIIAEPVFDIGLSESPDRQGIAFQNPKHAEILRQKTADYYHLEREGCKAGKEKPVIGILNRNSTRSLLNARALQHSLSTFSDKPVEIVCFEGKSFQEQVSFMMKTDILVSPHGAQLSSINFMQECGGVFEVFPRGYFWPQFFGPLAATSGLFHGYGYTGFDLKKEWYQKGAQEFRYRSRARRRDVCAPLDTSLDVVLKLIDKWKSCCRDRLAGESPDTLVAS